MDVDICTVGLKLVVGSCLLLKLHLSDFLYFLETLFIKVLELQILSKSVDRVLLCDPQNCLIKLLASLLELITAN